MNDPMIGRAVTNKASSPSENPTPHVLPWAGTWVQLAVKAFVVADTRVTKSEEIEFALKKLKTDGGSHRFYRGELCTHEAVTKIIRIFFLLVNDLHWLPQPTLSPERFEAVLSGIIRQWEGVFGAASQHANRQRILTRGMIRQVMYEAAIVAGFLAAKSSSAKELLEAHWHSPAALSRWMNYLCYEGGLSEARVLKTACLSRSVWRRLVNDGLVPESFGFHSFAAALHPEDAAAQDRLIVALKRAFAAREFARLLEQEVDVGQPPRDFWDDTWAKFVYFSAMACGRTQRNEPGIGLGHIQDEVAIIVGSAQPVSIWKIHAQATRHGDLWSLWDDYAGFAESYAREHEVKDAQQLEEAVIGAILETWFSDESKLRRRLFRATTFAETEQCLNELLRLEPEDLGCWSQLGSVYRKEKLWAKAEKAFRTAASLPLSGSSEKLTLANFLSERGRTSEAREILDAVKDETDRSWVYAKACFVFDLNERDEAIHWLNRCISMGHRLADCHGMLMQVYLKAGDQASVAKHRRESERFRLAQHSNGK